jgi:hypothetical protein
LQHFCHFALHFSFLRFAMQMHFALFLKLSRKSNSASHLSMLHHVIALDPYSMKIVKKNCLGPLLLVILISALETLQNAVIH